MKTKKYFISILLLIAASTSSFSNDLEPYWYHLPEDGPMPSEKLFGIGSFKKKMKKLIRVQQNAFDEVEEKNSEWKLEAMNTSLALGLSGSLGIFSWGGTKSVEMFWNRRGQKSSPKKDLTYNNIVEFNEDMSKDSIEGQINPLVESLYNSGKLKNKDRAKKELYKTADKFFKSVQAISVARTTGWSVERFRMDLIVSLDGSVTGFFTKVGGDVRLRFEWKKNHNKVMKKLINRDIVFDRGQKALKGLVQNFVEDFNTSKLKEIEKSDFDLEYVRLGLFITAKGDVGVLKGSASFNPEIFFHPVKEELNTKKSVSKTKDYSLIISSPSEKHLLYAKNMNIPFAKSKDSAMFKISRKKFKKGMKKAVKFAAKSAKRISKYSNKKSKWGIKQFRSTYAFSLSGDVGVVSLKGTPTIALQFINHNL